MNSSEQPDFELDVDELANRRLDDDLPGQIPADLTPEQCRRLADYLLLDSLLLHIGQETKEGGLAPSHLAEGSEHSCSARCLSPSFPTDALPTDALPTDALPTDALPTDALPTDALPTDALPTDALPTDALPTDTEQQLGQAMLAIEAHQPRVATPAPLVSFLGGTARGTIDYFSSGWPVAYLVATVVLGIGLLIGAFSYISTPAQIVQQAAPLPPPLSPLPSFVGRITGMVDCRWADPSTATMDRASVPLGRTYALSSGMMEITYNTGAKVILQGPVTYTVESATGGFVSVGKLTARVEKKEEGRTKNEELSVSRSSLLIPHSYFAVRTPTAVVTDLGTEFGVEVDPSGEVETCVLVGKVRLEATGSRVNAIPQVLVAGQIGRVVTQEGKPTIHISASGKDNHFVRSLRTVPSRGILIDRNVNNGSFESPPVGPDNNDGYSAKWDVYWKVDGEIIPTCWNPTYVIQTKGRLVSGVTGEQYVIIRNPLPFLSITFDGAVGHPAARIYEPDTKYALTADIGGCAEGVRVCVSFDASKHQLSQSITIADRDVMKPMPVLLLDTREHPEFVGKYIMVDFESLQSDQVYVDNVTLTGFPSEALIRDQESDRSGNSSQGVQVPKDLKGAE